MTSNLVLFPIKLFSFSPVTRLFCLFKLLVIRYASYNIVIKLFRLFSSGSCRDTYGLPDLNYIRLGEQETRAFCTSEFSDISPLTGGSVPFSTLEGRPSAKFYDSKSEFWVRKYYCYDFPL